MELALVPSRTLGESGTEGVRGRVIFGEGREGAWRRRGFIWFMYGGIPRFRGGPGEGVAEEAGTVRVRRGGPGKGVAEEDTGAGRRAVAEGGGGGVLALPLVCRSCTAPQINLGCLETYWASSRLVIVLLQGCIRVMSFKKKKKKIPPRGGPP